MVLLVVNTNVLSKEITIEDFIDHGIQISPIWSGDPLDSHVYQGQKIVQRTITIRQRVQSGGSAISAAGGDFGGRTSGGFTQLTNRPTQGVGGFGVTIREITQDTEGGLLGEGEEQADQQRLLMTERHTQKPLTLGLPGNQIDVIDTEDQFVFRFVRLAEIPA